MNLIMNHEVPYIAGDFFRRRLTVIAPIHSLFGQQVSLAVDNTVLYYVRICCHVLTFFAPETGIRADKSEVHYCRDNRTERLLIYQNFK
jgi:hypothetical protein